MEQKTRHLSSREIRILARLAEGDTYAEVRSYFGMTFQNLSSTCFNIRQKSGIKETRDQSECKRYLSKLDPQRMADALNPAYKTTSKPLTYCQREVFFLLALGRTYEQIAAFLGITSQSVQNLACRGAKRAGIVHAGWDRLKYIKQWVKREKGELPPEPVNPMDDPMF